MQKLVSAIENRGLKIGKAMYLELTGLRKPVLDKSNILHWPVLLLYAEVMSSDFIEDFCETDMFSVHLDMISFSVKWFMVYGLLVFMNMNVLCTALAIKHIFRRSAVVMGCWKQLQTWIYWIILWGKLLLKFCCSLTLFAFFKCNVATFCLWKMCKL